MPTRPDTELELPGTLARARQLARTPAWSAQLHAQTRSQRMLAPLAERLVVRHTPRDAAERLAGELQSRLTPTPAAASDQELTLAPFSPPLRQISTARQGAPEWGSAAAETEPAPLHTPPTLDHTVEWLPPAPMGPLLGELMAQGWGRRLPKERI